MRFRTLLTSLKSRESVATFRHCPHRPRTPRLAVEALDDRCLPSTFTVTNLLASGAGSLQAAVVAANANPGADAIDFAVTGTIPTGELNITDSLTINGPGQSVLTVSGEGNSQVFAITGTPTVLIANLTVANGYTIDSPGGGISMTGGTVTLDHVTVTGNTAVGAHGVWDGGPAGNGVGGGIYVEGGTLSIDQCTISGNYAMGGNGNIIPYYNAGYDGGIGVGGGLFIYSGTVHVNQSTISNNGAWGGQGGGYGDVAFGGYGGSATGGGIYVFGGTLEVRQSTITQNSAYGGLGGQGYINSGLPGVGQGGGLYIAPATPPRADLDTDTVSNTINNFANIDPNISGPYTSNGGTFNPTLSISDVSTPEGNTGTHAITFTVSLSAASNQPITVAYATANGTAAAGSDYQAASGTLTFAPGETTKTITVAVLGDLVYEPNETFAVNLSGATNATIADGNGLGTIVNDDTYVTPSISIGDVSKAEGRNGNTMFTFTVTLSAPSTTTVTVNYSTANGMATALEDYTAASGTLTFAPGETTKTITIKVKGDRKREADETFFVNLFGASSNATILDTQGIGTILNDD